MSVGFQHPKAKVHIGDGFKFLDDYKNAFDVIITDSSDPEGPAESLFQKPYFQLMHDALREGGVITTQGCTSPYVRNRCAAPGAGGAVARRLAKTPACLKKLSYVAQSSLPRPFPTPFSSVSFFCYGILFLLRFALLLRFSSPAFLSTQAPQNPLPRLYKSGAAGKDAHLSYIMKKVLLPLS